MGFEIKVLLSIDDILEWTIICPLCGFPNWNNNFLHLVTSSDDGSTGFFLNLATESLFFPFVFFEKYLLWYDRLHIFCLVALSPLPLGWGLHFLLLAYHRGQSLPSSS